MKTVRTICHTCILTLAFACFATIPARAQLANNPKAQDYVAQIDKATYDMVDQHLGLVVDEGSIVLHSIAVVMAVILLVKMLAAGAIDSAVIVEFVITYIALYSMLQFYDSPMPWGIGLSFHQLIPAEGRWISSLLDLTTLDDLLKSIAALFAGVQFPGPWNIMGIFVYLGFMVNLAILWFLSYGITSLGTIFLAATTLLGPVLIPCLMLPPISFLFYGWLRSMVIYSLFRVAASAVLFVFAQVVMSFVNSNLSDLSLGHLALTIVPFTALNAAAVYALFHSYRFAADLVGGSGGGGNPFQGAVRVIAAAITKRGK